MRPIFWTADPIGPRRRRRAATAALATVSATLALLTQALAARAAHAARPDASEGNASTRIVWSQFTGDDTGTARLVIAGPRGQQPHPITHPGVGAQDIDPKISPDGRTVAYERDDRDGAAHAYLVGVDGTGERELSVPCADACPGLQAPNWTPDGHRLVFTQVFGPFDQVNNSARSAVLWTSDLHGQHLRRLSEPGIDGALEDYNASFAPKGYIVFTRVRNSDIKSAAFRMNPDGTHVRRLTPWSLGADTLSVSPALHGPTADLVVLETYGQGAPDGVSSAVATVSAVEGAKSIRYLTSQKALPQQNFNPGWAPDGRRIVFVKFSADRAAGTFVGDIWTMSWNGHDQRAVSTSPLFEFRPTWGRAPRDT